MPHTFKYICCGLATLRTVTYRIECGVVEIKEERDIYPDSVLCRGSGQVGRMCFTGIFVSSVKGHTTEHLIIQVSGRVCRKYGFDLRQKAQFVDLLGMLTMACNMVCSYFRYFKTYLQIFVDRNP